MNDSEADSIASPCVRLCTLNEHDICLGCGRTVEEICAWRGMNADSRRHTIEKANRRRDQLGVQWDHLS